MKPLTKRQKEVLSLVARGLSSKRIAGMLLISKKVVDEHCAAACRALGARNRTEAALRHCAVGELGEGCLRTFSLSNECSPGTKLR